jgi:hypothetical protein
MPRQHARPALTAVFAEPATADGFLPLLEQIHASYELRPATELETTDLTAYTAVVVLADGYRQAEPQPVKLGREAADKLTAFVRAGGRCYVEYAVGLVPTAAPRPKSFERIYVPQPSALTTLPPLTILDEQQSWLLPVDPPAEAIELLSYGRVAGVYDAVYGPPPQSFPALLEIPIGDGRLFFATTAFSNFKHGHYRLTSRWETLVRGLLISLQDNPDEITAALATATVRTSPRAWAASGTPARLLVSAPAGKPVTADVPLTEISPGEWESEPLELADGEHVFTVISGEGDWQSAATARLVVSSREKRYERMLKRCFDWTESAGMLYGQPDGSAGIAEGFMSEIHPDGSHPFRDYRRGDCYVESAYAYQLYADYTGDKSYETIAGNLMRLVLDGMQILDRTAVYGSWETREYWKTLVEMDNLFSDDDGWISAMVLENGIRRGHDGTVAQGLRGAETLIRTAHGELGLQPNPWRTPSYLIGQGWDTIARTPLTENLDVSAHWQSTPQTAYLLAYAATSDRRYLDVAMRGLDHMVAEFPRMRLETSRTAEYIRFLLPLIAAYHYTKEQRYRDVIMRIGEFLHEHRDPESGALPEWDGRNPTSNAAYGEDEQSIVQRNGDTVTDQLYTVGFAAMFLPMAFHVTGEQLFDDLATGVLDYLSRIQIDDDSPLSGAWMRSFDFAHWEYSGSNADIGWGPYCVETGWQNAPILIGAMLKLTGREFFPPVGDRQDLSSRVTAEFDAILHPTPMPTEPPAAGGQVVASQLLNTVQIFWRGADDRVSHTYVDAKVGVGPWDRHDTQPVGGNPVAVDNPATGAVEVYVRDTSGRLVHTYIHKDTGRGPWRQVGDLVFQGDPALLFDDGANEVEVYVLGSDNCIHHTSALDLRHGYTPWERIRPVRFSGSPTIVRNRTTGRAEIYAIDAAGILRHTYKINRDHVGWRPVTDLKLTGTPAAAYNPRTKQVELFALDEHGTVHHGQFGGEWKSLGSFAATGRLRAVDNPTAGSITVVARSRDGQLCHWNGGTWTALGTGTVGDPAVAYHPGLQEVEIYATTVDGQLARATLSGDGFVTVGSATGLHTADV